MYKWRLHLNFTTFKTCFLLRLPWSRGLPFNYAYWCCCHGCCFVIGSFKYRLPSTSNSWTFGCLINYEVRSCHNFTKQNWYHFQGWIKNKRKLQTNQIIHQRHKMEKRSNHPNFSWTRLQYRCSLWINLQHSNSKKKLNSPTKNDHYS